MPNLPRLAICLLAACLVGGSRADSSNPLLGDWARTHAACVRPELSFAPASAAIRLDADGVPVSFRYPSVTYRLSAGRVTAEMGRRHPLAKTPDKFSLRFVVAPDGRAVLQLRDRKTVSYTRCLSEKRL